MVARFGIWSGRQTGMMLRWTGSLVARFGIWSGRQTGMMLQRLIPSIERSFDSASRNAKLNIIQMNREISTLAYWTRTATIVTAGIFTYLVKLYFTKSLSVVNLQTTKLIFRNIDKKMQEEGSEYAECAFFFTTNENDLYLKSLYPVMDKLKERGVGFQVFAIDIRTAGVLSSKKIQFINLFDDVNILAEEIKRSFDGKELGNKIEQSAIKNNLSLLYLKQLSGYFFSEACRSVAISLIAEHIIKQTRLKSVVIAADGQMFGNAVIAACRKYGIPSFFVPSTIINANPLHAEWIRSDKICIYGLQGLDVLTDLGYKKENIILTGSPKYDYLKKFDQQKSKEELERLYQIDSKKKLVVIGMARWHHDDELWMSDFIRFCNRNNLEIVIKIHPMYKADLHEESQYKIGKIEEVCRGFKYRITYDIDLYTLLSAADLTITDYSNVGAESVILEKPLLTVNFVKESLDNEQRYHETGAAIYFEDYNEFEKTAFEILMEGKHVEDLRKGRKHMNDMYNYFNDGNAAERVVNLILGTERLPGTVRIKEVNRNT